jgi:hypothetical protein
MVCILKGERCGQGYISTLFRRASSLTNEIRLLCDDFRRLHLVFCRTQCFLDHVQFHISVCALARFKQVIFKFWGLVTMFLNNDNVSRQPEKDKNTSRSLVFHAKHSSQLTCKGEEKTPPDEGTFMFDVEESG